jgi:hypothetical protein
VTKRWLLHPLGDLFFIYTLDTIANDSGLFNLSDWACVFLHTVVLLSSVVEFGRWQIFFTFLYWSGGWLRKMVLGIPGISAGSGPRVEWTKGSHPLKFIKLVPGSIFPSSLSQGVDRWPLIPVGCRGPFRYSVGLSLQFFFFF